MSETSETFSRVNIYALLNNAGWTITDGMSVLFEPALSDGSGAHYVPNCVRIAGRKILNAI